MSRQQQEGQTNDMRDSCNLVDSMMFVFHGKAENMPVYLQSSSRMPLIVLVSSLASTARPDAVQGGFFPPRDGKVWDRLANFGSLGELKNKTHYPLFKPL